MERKTNIYFIFGAMVVLILGLAAIFGGYGWFLGKQQRVLTGAASPSFPYSDYSLEELNKMYPQYPSENVKTTQTPEETYAKFIAALKAGDLDGAMKNFTSRKSEEYLRAFNKAQKEKVLDATIKVLDRPIKLKNKLDTFAYYTLENDENENFMIEFVKNFNGVWKIDSL